MTKHRFGHYFCQESLSVPKDAENPTARITRYRNSPISREDRLTPIFLQERVRINGTFMWYRRGMNRLYNALLEEKLVYMIELLMSK